MKKLHLAAALVVLFTLLYAQATAEVPKKINYQGKLTDANGGLIVSDTVEIEFNIYTDSTGGSSIWTETHSYVPVRYGLFSVVLGSDTEIPDSIFNGSTKYLGITVEQDAESVPRMPMLSVSYAYRALRADTTDFCFTQADSDWVIAHPNIYRIQGSVGIGTSTPDAKLDVVVGSDQAIEAKAEGNSGGKVGGEFYAEGTGYSNVGVFARAGCYGLGCSSASYCNIGIYAKEGTDGTQDVLPSGDWAGYFKGDVKITGDLDIGGTIEMPMQYNSGWFSLSEGGTTTLTHNLGGDEEDYIVFLDGKSSDGKIHQADFGTVCYHEGVTQKCVGCEWYGLTNSQIRVHRATDDDEMSPNKDWDECRIRILKNQL